MENSVQQKTREKKGERKARQVGCRGRERWEEEG